MKVYKKYLMKKFAPGTLEHCGVPTALAGYSEECKQGVCAVDHCRECLDVYNFIKSHSTKWWDDFRSRGARLWGTVDSHICAVYEDNVEYIEYVLEDIGLQDEEKECHDA